MSAEYLMKKYLADNNITGIEVSSAGTMPEGQVAWPETIEQVEKYGCNPRVHKKRKISKEILGDQDLIVCMADHHQDAVEALGFKSVLFKELSEGKKENLLDDDEYGRVHGYDFDVIQYVRDTIDYIHEMMPKVLEEIEKIN
jgi:protein-tyrosine-phosphatase